MLAGAAALGIPLVKAKRRIELSRAKHRSLAGHARLARRIASLVPFYEYDEQQFFRSDDPPEDIAIRRRDGFMRLAAIYRERFARTSARPPRSGAELSDLQFTSAYRVPFQFSRHVREHLAAGSILQSSAGVTVSDVDGNVLYDVANSYGVNLFGYDFYKECIARGAERVRDLGPVLGAYHPIVAYNIERIRQISGLDEVSFHMSGTEAVMQAVRLARYHTRRSHIVRFCRRLSWLVERRSARHRQSFGRARDLHSGRDVRAHAARASHAPGYRLRARQSAPGAASECGRPADSSLVDSGRAAHFDRQAYTRWLQQLRAVCTERKIALIFDEVFVGFRLALGGAQEYFGVQADLVTYGKTLGGGLPVGVVCGRHEWMKRFRDDRPADVCLARGTFNCASLRHGRDERVSPSLGDACDAAAL